MTSKGCIDGGRRRNAGTGLGRQELPGAQDEPCRVSVRAGFALRPEGGLYTY
jgi:hypothetical protein